MSTRQKNYVNLSEKHVDLLRRLVKNQIDK